MRSIGPSDMPGIEFDEAAIIPGPVYEAIRERIACYSENYYDRQIGIRWSRFEMLTRLRPWEIGVILMDTYWRWRYILFNPYRRING